MQLPSIVKTDRLLGLVMQSAGQMSMRMSVGKACFVMRKTPDNGTRELTLTWRRIGQDLRYPGCLVRR